jgi:hypothetical protein
MKKNWLQDAAIKSHRKESEDRPHLQRYMSVCEIREKEAGCLILLIIISLLLAAG